MTEVVALQVGRLEGEAHSLSTEHGMFEILN